MVGLFGGESIMTLKPTLNYTKFMATKCLPFNTKSSVYGHEFHYSKMSHVPNDAKFAYKMSKGVGIQDKMDGFIEYESLASYGHLYFNSKMAKYHRCCSCIISQIRLVRKLVYCIYNCGSRWTPTFTTHVCYIRKICQSKIIFGFYS